MTDPLSIAAGIVGVALPALQAVRLLSDSIHKLKDATGTIQALRNELSVLDTAIVSIRGIKHQEWAELGNEIATNVKRNMSLCKRACESFQADFQHWTRHSPDGSLSWRDRASVGFFKESNIKSVSEQLQACKMTINATVNISVLYGMIRQGHSISELQDRFDVMQTDIKRIITMVEAQSLALKDRVSQLKLNSGEYQDRSEHPTGKIEALRHSEYENSTLATSLDLLRDLLSKSKKEDTKIIFGPNNSGLQAGLINGTVNFGKT